MRLQAPPEHSKALFLQYAALEEQYGLSRSAMAVYEQAVRTVPVPERLPLYDQYLKRASDIFGVGKVCCLHACCARRVHAHPRSWKLLLKLACLGAAVTITRLQLPVPQARVRHLQGRQGALPACLHASCARWVHAHPCS